VSQEILFARNGLPQLAARLAELGTRRVLVVSAPSRRFVGEAVAALAAFEPAVFDGAKVHVPRAVVERAAESLAAARADTVVAIGGGSAIGAAKALRLAHDVRFAAVPTTYAGSERTSLYGITDGAEKKTGRDPRVRPDLVLYDATLAAAMRAGLALQSLMNALAHPLSVLSTGSLDAGDRTLALDTVAALLRAMEDVLVAPAALAPRERALRAASAAGELADRGKFGAQHALAHLLGGALGLDHGGLHAVLLPHFVAHLRAQDPALVGALGAAAGRPDLEPYLHDLLVRAGVPVSLDALGAEPAAVLRVLATRPALPAAIALDAQHGLRPTGRSGRVALGAPPLAMLAGPAPERARRVVVALHGRAAEAGTIVRRFAEIAGHDPATAIVGLRTEGDRWYSVRYGQPGAGADEEVRRAIARVDESLSALAALGVPAERTVLAGFSQGACLALECAARMDRRFAAVVAPSGARIGVPGEWAPPREGALRGVAVLLGAATEDRWIRQEDLAATAEWLGGAGAAVSVVGCPGDRHEIAPRFRLFAREHLLGRAAPPGPAGFGNTHQSEALAGALPPRQNSPRLPAHGLHAEQLSGTGFTAPRAASARTWCYRIRPSSQRRAFAPLAHPLFGAGFEGRPPAIDLAGWAPLPLPDAPRDFLDGLVTLGGAGSPALRRGWAVHRWAANRDMGARAFYDADGDLLLVPEQGAITLLTELGPLDVAPGQIAVVPRGVTFSVLLHGALSRGYAAETFGRAFQLPERGAIGANGLADPRHFRAPAAWYEDRLAPDFRIVAKLGGRLHEASQDHSPFDVVAWHGNHAPYVYDLDDFSPVAGVRFDHTDPSVYTVLSSPLDEPGTHALDLIVFPPRWDPTEGTFRPPFFHRNVTTEVNGIVREEGPPGSPFVPGVCFVTPAMTAHGVGGSTVARVRAAPDADADRPVRQGGASLWFQLESALPMSLTPWAEEQRLADWPATWDAHPGNFEPLPEPD